MCLEFPTLGRLLGRVRASIDRFLGRFGETSHRK
jgi:hypothetical protein